MICPHCKKPISKTISKAVKDKAIKLHKEGYSMRDIQSLLGGQISFSSVSRLVSRKND